MDGKFGHWEDWPETRIFMVSRGSVLALVMPRPFPLTPPSHLRFWLKCFRHLFDGWPTAFCFCILATVKLWKRGRFSGALANGLPPHARHAWLCLCFCQVTQHIVYPTQKLKNTYLIRTVKSGDYQEQWPRKLRKLGVLLGWLLSKLEQNKSAN